MLVLLAGAGAGCSPDDELTDSRETMFAALSEAESETQRHDEACTGATSMPQMMNELTYHDGRMADVMRRMDQAHRHMANEPMHGMGRCRGSSLDGMAAAMNGMHAEMSGHSERMHAAESLSTARTECSDHTHIIGEMTRGMMDELDSMSCTAR
jgi:hypothetical protein